MKTLKIDEYCELTTDHVASHYGIPVLAYYSTGRGFGPSQKVVAEKFSAIWPGERSTAAYAVYAWAIQHTELTEDELNFVKLFLGQWPEGPQIETKKKFKIWKTDPNDQFGRLVDVTDIITAVDCSQQVVYRFNRGVTEEQVMAAYAAVDHEEYASIADWLEASDLVDSKPEYLDIADDCLCYEPGNGFFTAADWEADAFRMIKVWDGNNLVRIYEPDEYGEVIPVEYDPGSAVSLDERDSNGNLNSGTNGLHHKAAKLSDGSILVIHWSQWQGDYTTAAVMSAAEFDSYCSRCKISNPYQIKPTAARASSGKSSAITLRISAELKDKLISAAAAENRNISNYIELLIKRELDQK